MTEEILRIVDGFKQQGVRLVYVAECCGRVYVGLEPPKRCRTCTKTPIVETVEISAETEDATSSE